MEVMLAIPRVEAIGHALAQVFPADFLSEFDRVRAEQGAATLYKFRLPTPAGELRSANITIAPLLNREFQAVGRIVIVDDITDRINMETQLTQSEKLSSIGLLAAGVAHEVNTPLAVISSYAQMLSKQLLSKQVVLDEATHARLQPVLDKITQQTFRASEIVNGLLNFSRMGSSEFSLVDLNAVVRDTALLLEHQLRSANVEVVISLDEALPAISGNRGKLQQVLVNFILNAKDALHAREGARIRLSTQHAGSAVRLRVEDNGIGMSEDVLRRIYDPFFTTKSNPAQGQRKGTGLGLAVTYGIVQEHAGTIDVSSTVGEGTVFEVVFPAAESPGRTSSSGSTLDEGKVSTCLVPLLVSNSSPQKPLWSSPAPACASSSSMTSRASATPSKLSSTSKASLSISRPTALRASICITRNTYDLLLLDLALPGESGLDLLPRIRSLAPDLPIIMITAYGTVGNVVDAIHAGASNFIQKPWDNEKLLADIRSAIGKQKAEREVVQLKRTLKQRYSFKNIVGKSDIMLRLFDLVSQVAPSRSTVLIQGESGTGKELIAKAIHANSPRRDKPFIPVNTGAVPSDLLESALFGHERGAFTSAVAAKKGLFEVADQRHALPRRDRHHVHRHAGQDPARPAGPPLHAPRRHAGDPGRRPHRRRHQRQPAAGRRRRPLPRRPLLPPQRHLARAPAAAQPQAKTSRCSSSTSSSSTPKRTASPRPTSRQTLCAS